MTRGSNFGIEAEFFGINRTDAARILRQHGVNAVAVSYSHENTEYWKVTSDSSVSREGNELVSPILSMGKPAFRDVRKAMKALSLYGGEVDRSCGLHIHHNGRGITPPDIVRMATTYALFQPAILECLPHSRSQTTYCKPANGEWVRRVIDGVVDYYNSGFRYTGRGTDAFYDRYWTINFSALEAHGSLEFRQHSATLNPQKIEMWSRLTHAIMHSPKSPTDILDAWGANIGSLDQVAKHFTIDDVAQHLQLPEADRQYWNGRRQLFMNQDNRRISATLEGDHEDKQCNVRVGSNEEGDYDDYDSEYDAEDQRWEDCNGCGVEGAFHYACDQCHANNCYNDRTPHCGETSTYGR